MATTRKPGPRYWERIVKEFAGKVVGPTVVAKKIGTDRAYACHLLQTLVYRSKATKLVEHGKYRVHVPKSRRKVA